MKSLGPVPVKGRAEPVEVYGPGIGPRAHDCRPPLDVGSPVRRPGRGDRGASPILEQAGAGHGQVVAIVGDAGVGNSRLTWEFTRSHHVDGWLVLRGRSIVLREGHTVPARHRAAEELSRDPGARRPAPGSRASGGQAPDTRPNARGPLRRRCWPCSTCPSTTLRGTPSILRNAGSVSWTRSRGCSSGKVRCNRSSWCSWISNGWTPRARRCSMP